MSLENKIELLCAAIKENTAVLQCVLASANVTPITEAPKPAKKKAEKVEPVAVVEEPVAVVEEPVAVVEEPVAVVEEPVTEATPETETTLDPEALITQITDSWKAQLAAANPERKVMLKDKFPELRAKWGLAADAKLITLAPTPEKLAGLLADIKAL